MTEVPSALRLALVLGARRGVERVKACDALKRFRAGLALPPGSSTRIAAWGEDDPFAESVGERKLDEPIDAVVEVTLPRDGDPARLVAAALGAAARLADAFDPARCNAVAGPVHFLAQGDGPILMAMAGRRDVACDADAFSRWWLTRHGPMALEIMGDHWRSYEQLHGDDALTARACDASGFGGARYAVYESNFFTSLEDFVAPLTRPEIVARVFEDEIGFLDHDGMRMGWTEQVDGPTCP